MLRPAAKIAEPHVPSAVPKFATLSFALSVALYIALPVAIAPFLSHESMAAGRPSENQPSTRFFFGRGHEVRGSVFETWVERRDRGVVKQSLDYSCGIAALATLLAMSFDVEVSEPYLLALLEDRGSDWQLESDWRERGVSMAILRKLAAYYDLNTIGVSVSAAGLVQLQRPAIALIDYRGSPHFTVIKPPLADNRIELADPSWGNRTLTRWQFLPMFLSGDRGKLLLVDRR